MAEKMKRNISYKAGKKVVKMPDGKERELSKEEVESYRQYLVRRKEAVDRQIGQIDADLVQMEKSIKIKQKEKGGEV
jgi:hypothetical protein